MENKPDWADYAYATVDKSDWGPGPWQEEHWDKVQFTDKATELPCLIVRNFDLGHLCGYVGVSEGHPAFTKPYGDVEVSVHGGLTFSGPCREGAEEHGICHIPKPGEPDKVWWLGFDCAHCYDLVPGMKKFNKKFDEEHPEFHGVRDRDVYRDVEYVRAECENLARQLAEIGAEA